MTIFDELESSVQSYARSFPCTFHKAKGEYLFDEQGRAYLDFLSGAGTLNYGHNNERFKQALIEYIQDDGITHGLDMHTRAKEAFLQSFNRYILKPRHLEYRLQFTGPTGTNTVEAAIKLARKVTGRNNIISFTNGFHGVTLGALSATGNSHHRQAAGVSLSDNTRMPFDGYMGDGIDTTQYLEKVLNDASSGVDLPAAVIVETVQGEGGINAASFTWLKSLEKLCHQHDILLIVDDIQAGCGRTGTFFSFESAGIKPDMVTLSKSISGYGLPFALLLLRPDLDQWSPAEHNGTFRGNNVAFVTAKAAIDCYWQDEQFAQGIQDKSHLLKNRLESLAQQYGDGQFKAKGRGMFQGISCVTGELAGKISKNAFSKGLIIETSGADSEVLKCLCPLTITKESLNRGLDILEQAMREVLAKTEQIPEQKQYLDYDIAS